MCEEEIFALGQSDRVRRDGTQIVEGRSWAADKLMFNVQDRFRDHGKIAFKEQVVDAYDGTGERVFNGCEESVGIATGNRSERRVERRARNRCDRFTEELNGGGFAECAAFALKCDARGF